MDRQNMQALSPAETEVIRLVWNLGQASVQDVCDALPEDRAVTYATVQTLLRRLEKKGYVGHETQGKAHVFSAEAEPEALQRIIDVNLAGPMHLTRAVVARMLAAGGGHLVTITSLATRIQTPQRTVYTAAKMGLHGLFDSLRGEVEPHGVAITLIVPGFVRTEISESAVTANGDAYGMTGDQHARGMPPDRCAQRILAGVAARRREFSVAVTPLLRYAAFVRRYLPWLYFKLIAKAKVT